MELCSYSIYWVFIGGRVLHEFCDGCRRLECFFSTLDQKDLYELHDVNKTVIASKLLVVDLMYYVEKYPCLLHTTITL